jgi:hypothetical protein
MRRIVLVLAAMVVTLGVAGGVALALNKIGTNGPDTLRGTNGDDNLIGRAPTTGSSPSMAATTCWAGRARIGLRAIQRRGHSEATRTYREVPATI